MILSMRSINYSLIYEEYTSRCAAQGKASQLELTTAVARKQARRLHSRFKAGATVPTGVLWRSNLDPGARAPIECQHRSVLPHQ